MKKIPKFKNEEEERDFWQTHDSTKYVDWEKAQRLTLANLKPSLKTISLRLPESMLEELKLLANKRDVPYQSLVKVFLADRIEQELSGKAGHNKAVQRIAKKAGSR
jgi:predicted DNA binding CopG/RHH family protein